MNENSVVALKDYGSITFHLKELMDKKGVTRGRLSKLANIRFEVADKWYNGNVERVDIDILARICFALDCELHEIMTYDK